MFESKKLKRALSSSSGKKLNKKTQSPANFLSNAKEKIDANQEVYELVESAKIDYIEVKTPLHKYPEANFSIQDKEIAQYPSFVWRMLLDLCSYQMY